MRVAIYGRVSTEEQAQEGFSIAAQKEKLTAFVHSQDWDIYDYYIDEGISAKNTDRPQLQRLLKDIRDRNVDVVLVYKLDRLTRSVLDLYQLLQEFDRYDVKFKSATEVYDTTTAIGRLFITLVAALAQWERENLAERVKFGQEQMVNELKRPGGRPPFGYDLKNGTLKINEEEAVIVRDIFSRYLQGEGLDWIAMELNRRGSITKQGKKWDKMTVKILLENQTYYGALRWNYRKGGRKINSPDEWIIIEDVYEPIIEKETFLRAQQVKNSRSLKHPRQLASDFIFSGVLTCGRCGAIMYGKASRSMATGRYYSQRHYVCKNVKQKNCDAPYIKETRLEDFFLIELVKYSNASSSMKAVRKQKMPTQKNVATIQKELSKLVEKRKRWQTMFAEGLIEIEDLRQRLAEDREKEVELRKLLEETEEEVTLTDSQIRSLVENIQMVWDVAEISEKKQLVSILVKNISADTDNQTAMKLGKNRELIIKSLTFN
ncbi:recombinase family protein [Brevibacillus brevis]|uniref:recombinase family protein n=1 Tax=Brevibacillus brevis TaxID=1393 RepID=UPI00165E18A5|nr:recombinase family protein [Brevibacillus brevis]